MGDLLRDCAALLSGRGEASGVAMATSILERYARLEPASRWRILEALAAGRFGADRKRLEQAMARYRERPDAAATMALHKAAEPRRQELLRRLNLAPGGTAALVRMREDLLAGAAQPGAAPELAVVDADFVHLFASWFNRGFLVLRRIDWTTPAHILEKIIRYEAVHQIDSWDDLRARLEPPDRRCFAFFHPALVDEPLIFVEVALQDAIPDAIAPILAAGRAPIDPAKATTAVFYSISNCQVGLRGVSFGNFLIKQVVEELRREFAALDTFVTLSPVPGFMAWLARARAARQPGPFGADDLAALQALESPGWHDDAALRRALRPALSNAIAYYLLVARDRQGSAADPVARFHLGNGARLARVNWMADTSAKGLAQAAGFMVNYLYALDEIERNHEAFANHGEIVTQHAVKRLLRDPAPLLRRRPVGEAAAGA
ncbi:MAG: malonyl-CoA decarboxylase [Burkholderiales bacterium]|nr:malonyl-CoA decarboxylase [Burkholderiales bacterium]